MSRAIAKPAAAAFVLIARVVKPQEWLEHLLAHRRRNARSVIVHSYGEQRWSQWPVIASVGANRAALETRLARQRLNAAGRTVTSGWPWKATVARCPCRSVLARSGNPAPSAS